MSDPRLLSDRNIWLATVRIYICTESKSVKVRNIKANPRASAALEDGGKPMIAEGTAALLERPYPDDVVAAFTDKYQWDISTDGSYNLLIEIAPEKWLKW
jgi:hypothetical protein